MTGSLFSECLVAMTGIFPSNPPSELFVRGAATYETRIRRRLASFLAATEAAKIKWDKPPEQAKLWKDLTEPVSPGIEEVSIIDHIDGVDPVDIGSYVLVLQAAREKARAAWPTYPDPSLGLHNCELSVDEYGDVWHLVRTLNDPETIFDDMDSLLLLPSQVEAVASVYPNLYEAIRNLAALLLLPYTDIDGQKQRRALAYEREEQIRTLLGLPLDVPIPAPEQAQSPAPKPRARPEEEEPVPSEHTAERRVATR